MTVNLSWKEYIKQKKNGWQIFKNVCRCEKSFGTKKNKCNYCGKTKLNYNYVN